MLIRKWFSVTFHFEHVPPGSVLPWIRVPSLTAKPVIIGFPPLPLALLHSRDNIITWGNLLLFSPLNAWNLDSTSCLYLLGSISAPLGPVLFLHSPTTYNALSCSLSCLRSWKNNSGVIPFIVGENFLSTSFLGCPPPPNPKSESRRESPGIERHDSTIFSRYSPQECWSLVLVRSCLSKARLKEAISVIFPSIVILCKEWQIQRQNR